MKILEILKRFRIYLENYLWIIFGYILRFLTIIFIVSKIANKIGLEDFGWYNLGISFFTILVTISALGFNPSFIIKYLADNHDNEEGQKSVLGTFLFSRILASCVILALLMLWITFSNIESKYWIVFIASISILFQSSEVLFAYFQWKLKANIYVSVTAISVTVSAVLLIIGLYFNWGVYFFMLVYAIERILTFMGILFVFNKKVFNVFTLRLKPDLLKKLALQSWPLMLGALLTALYSRFDQFLVKFYLDIDELGIYGTSVILSSIWYVVPSLIVPVLYPKIVELKKANNEDKYAKALTLLYGILNYAAIAVIVFTLVFGDVIVLQLYGEKYAKSIPILYVLIFNQIILFQSHLTTSVLILEEREKHLFKIKLVSVISNILLNILFLANYGAIFAAYSLIISALLSWIALSFFDKSMLKLLKLNLKSFLIPFYLKKIKL